MDEERERKAFEAWPGILWFPSARPDRDGQGGYYDTAVEYAWRAWKARAALAATGEAGAVTAPVDAVGWGIVTADGRLSDWRICLDRAKADRDCVDANLYGKRGPYRVVALVTRPEPT